LFRAELERAAIDDIRLALTQSPPLGNARFYARIEKMTGMRREARPRVESDSGGESVRGQGKLGL
jgi:putative transposase